MTVRLRNQTHVHLCISDLVVSCERTIFAHQAFAFLVEELFGLTRKWLYHYPLVSGSHWFPSTLTRSFAHSLCVVIRLCWRCKLYIKTVFRHFMFHVEMVDLLLNRACSGRVPIRWSILKDREHCLGSTKSLVEHWHHSPGATLEACPVHCSWREINCSFNWISESQSLELAPLVFEHLFDGNLQAKIVLCSSVLNMPTRLPTILLLGYLNIEWCAKQSDKYRRSLLLSNWKQHKFWIGSCSK